jgi:hypothetical protein
MSEPDTDSLDLLLETARRATLRGETTRARALLRMLSAQHPDDMRIWQALADVAADEAERRAVLDRLAALAPPTLSMPTEPALNPTPPAISDEQNPYRTRRIVIPRWPAIFVVAIAVVILGALALWRWGGALQGGLGAQPPATRLPGLVKTPAPGIATALPTAAPIETLPPAQTATPPPPTSPPPTPTRPPPTPLPPTLTPRPSLAPGQIVQVGGWNITLLRPDYALLLNGSIGGMQPQGRFALAVLAVANTGAAPARLPADLLALEDNRGVRYAPMAGASAAYLNTFGRGQYGDLSLDESIPPDAGNVSIPIIFDVPLEASDLRLVVGDSAASWPVPGRTQ